jgi:hypothetical protein
MKAKLLPFSALLMVFSIIGCGPPPTGGGTTIPQCDFDSTEQIAMTDFGLSFPGGMSTYFNNVFNQDIIYDLTQILETEGDYDPGPSLAMVTGNFKSDGTYCKGEKPFTYKKGNRNVMMNSVKVPAPSSTGFSGEVTITIRTDDFNNPSGGFYYYVRWKTTSNDASNFANGDLTGEKVSSDTQGIIIMPPDIPIYMDGGYQFTDETI